jgi:hypothetical protein
MDISIGFSQNGTPITTFTGPITDQAALHRVTVKIRDMNLPLILVIQVGSLPENQRNPNPNCWEDHLWRD